ncbi:MAG: type II toxin-antitoxin system RelE/ParE family toxin [Elusimicrobia bacterium]|nr:type II toxin-antitoxin system RelE/ParE family toxin [Elusimicrobiota bacterium]
MIIRWTHKAKEDYQSLPEAIQEKADKAFRLCQRNPRHPSLHVEKIDHKRDIWSARIDLNYRFTFQWVHGGIFVRRIASHQEAYRRP